jgi:hypothetical protein
MNGVDMSSVVCVKSGSYRGNRIVNATLELVKDFQTGKKGSYITVKNSLFPNLDIEDIKIKVESRNDYSFVEGGPSSTVMVEEQTHSTASSDEEAMNRIATRFAVLDEMSKACINGDIRAMIVSGPPGVGKSHGVESQMEKASMFDKIAGKRDRFNIVKGAISGIGLFATLYKYSDKRNVLVFDDCDVWEDQDALNILKGALDSGKRRRISWNKDSRLLRLEDVPHQFDFNGSIIFITNLDFNDRRSKKIKAHLDALQSRCHYLDLTIDTERDKILRIKQVHRDADGGLFKEYHFENGEGDKVLDFMFANVKRLREVSLRMALKIADLIKISPDNWQMLAENTCMHRVGVKH